MKIKLHSYNLKLGSYYDLTINKLFSFENLKFIKVTKKGYNFLDEKTNKCVLFRHIYESKHKNDIFIVSSLIKIKNIE